MKQYQIQGYFEDVGTWVNLSAVYDMNLPSMSTLEEAQKVMNEIHTRFPRGNMEHKRIVVRYVTPWKVVNP